MFKPSGSLLNELSLDQKLGKKRQELVIPIVIYCLISIRVGRSCINEVLKGSIFDCNCFIIKLA